MEILRIPRFVSLDKLLTQFGFEECCKNVEYLYFYGLEKDIFTQTDQCLVFNKVMLMILKTRYDI